MTAHNMRHGVYPSQVAQNYYPQTVLQSQPMEQHSFRQFYASQLATLTFNSRPIIQSLSFIAQEYAKMAEVVAQCLESHIRVVPPAIKLPALYLLDAIAKNIPVPYASVLAQHVTRIFVDAYEAVDSQTKWKMEEMLSTWRTGSPAHREVFGVVVQRNIENFVAAKHSSSPPTNSNGGHAQSMTPKLLTKNQILTEIDVLIALKQQALTLQIDQNTLSQVNTLKQLHSVVRNTDISQDELAGILAQLRSFSLTAAHTAQPAPLVKLEHPPTLQAIPTPHPPGPPLPDTSKPSNGLPQNLRAFISGLTASRPVTPNDNPMVNISSILGNLVKTGFVSANGTLASGTPTAAAESISTPEDISETDESFAIDQYANEILRLKIRATASEIVKHSPPLLQFLYNNRCYQCKQCALRFPEGAGGKRKLDEHLDLHFVQNSRNIQNAGRGHSRSWYVGLEGWIRDSKNQNIEAGRRHTAAIVEREVQLRDTFVIVPAGDEAKPTACPICRESLISEFREEDEEYIWRNAVEIEGKIYHATCHADSLSAPNSYLNRIKHQAGSRSRSATPEIHSRLNIPLSTSPEHSAIASKRKAADIDAAESSQYIREETPPSKRIALAPA